MARYKGNLMRILQELIEKFYRCWSNRKLSKLSKSELYKRKNIYNNVQSKKKKRKEKIEKKKTFNKKMKKVLATNCVELWKIYGKRSHWHFYTICAQKYGT